MFVDDNTVKECDCGQLDRERMQSKLQFASIPEAYKDISLKDLKLTYYSKNESRELFKTDMYRVKQYLDDLDKNIDEGKGIFIWSNTKGSGKTVTATALANELINKHRRFVKFATSLDILDEIRSTYGRHDEDTESKLLNDLSKAEFLVIDDFGTERATDWAGEKFYQIVNKRYINKKVTIYTSNFDLERLQYDDRITNRIKERSYVLHFPEESVRDVIARRENKWN